MRLKIIMIYALVFLTMHSSCKTSEIGKSTGMQHVPQFFYNIQIRFRDTDGNMNKIMETLNGQVAPRCMKEKELVFFFNRIKELEITTSNISNKQLNVLISGLDKIDGVIEVNVYKN